MIFHLRATRARIRHDKAELGLLQAAEATAVYRARMSETHISEPVDLPPLGCFMWNPWREIGKEDELQETNGKEKTTTETEEFAIIDST